MFGINFQIHFSNNTSTFSAAVQVINQRLCLCNSNHKAAAANEQLREIDLSGHGRRSANKVGGPDRGPNESPSLPLLPSPALEVGPVKSS